MKRLTTVGIALALSLASLGSPRADTSQKAKIDAPAPTFSLVDYKGKTQSLGSFEGKFVVLEWTNFDCPFVHKHYDSGNMQSLQKKYGDEGVVWLRICSSAPGKQGYYDPSEIEERLDKDKSAAADYLIDADGSVGRMYGAKTTPNMFVIDPKGILIYAGGIDDIKSTNKADIARATNYVSACLDAAMAGKPVAVKESTPYGCSVKSAKTESASN